MTSFWYHIKTLLEEQVPKLAGFNIVRFITYDYMIVKPYFIMLFLLSLTVLMVVRLFHGQRQWQSHTDSVLGKHGGI